MRKGEKGTCVVFWKFADARPGVEADESEETDGGKRRRAFAKAYIVFNAAQIDGFVAPEAPPLLEVDRDAGVEAFFDACRIETIIGGSRACYIPSRDVVHLPPFGAFITPAAAYAVRAHEYGHATAAAHRVGRALTGRFGDEAYAMEELVAELAAAFVTADLGIANDLLGMNASYIANWLKVLGDDKRAIFTATGQAQRAADWMHNQQVPIRIADEA